MRHTPLLMALTTCLTLPTWALADGVYTGLNLGMANASLRTPNGVDRNDQTVAGVVVGYQFTPYLALEGQYTGIGKVTDNLSGSAKADALSLSGVATLPLNETFSVYGKLGIAATKSKVSSGLSAYNDATRTGATFGLGAEYRFDNTLSMRVGYDHYQAEVDKTAGGSKSFDANVSSVGLVYRF